MFLFNWTSSNKSIECKFEYTNVHFIIVYTCFIEDKQIDDNEVYNYYGQHFDRHTIYDVSQIQLLNCTLTKFPRSLKDEFTNLKYLHIEGCKLMTISCNDLSSYQFLEGFASINNDLTFLPSDLFKNVVNLTSIFFREVKFALIEPDILDCLVDIRDVTFLDDHFYVLHHKPTQTDYQLKVVKDFLQRVICVKYAASMQHIEQTDKRIKNLELKSLNSKIMEQQRTLASLRSDIDDFRASNSALIEENKELDQLIKTQKSSENALNRQIHQLKSLNGTLKKDNGQLKQSNNSLQGQVQKLKNAQENSEAVLKEEIELLKVQLDHEAKTSDALQSKLINENKQLNISLKNLKQECKRLKVSNAGYEEIQQRLKSLNLFKKDNKVYKLLKSRLELKEAAEPKAGLLLELSTFIQDEATKNFKIIIGSQEFLVHKFLLIARSPTLAEVLKNNPEVENLNLVDIPMDIFEVILKFLYTDELPGDDRINFLHLFAAAGKLKIDMLVKHAETKIIDMVNCENALDILRASVSFELNDLKRKAFQEVKIKYKNIKFKDELMDAPEKLIRIIAMFRKKEEALKKFNEEFEELMSA